jgi:hypothetical protein
MDEIFEAYRKELTRDRIEIEKGEGEKRSQRKKGIPKQKYIHKMFKNWSVFAEDCYMHYRDGYLFPD